MKGLSAGRVQSVATRLVVERERERIAFRAAEYWDIVATLDPGGFDARLVAVDGHRVAQGRDFARSGELATADAVQLDEAPPASLAAALAGVAFTVRSVERKPYTRRPAAPFMTSTLQQEASRKLRFSAQHTMRVAQRLYENGYITYMRTDSTSLVGDGDRGGARAGPRRSTAPIPSPPSRASTTARSRTRRRPTRRSARPATASAIPTRSRREVERDEAALYDLVWKRTVASQMADARGETVSVRVGATAADGRDAEFGTAGTVITFRGFMLAYEEGRDEAVAADEEERRLPPLAEGDCARGDSARAGVALRPPPPPRYTEATLVRALEERGIGRPSTYASIMGTILDRGYVRKVGQALVPTFLAFAVTSLLEQHFGRLVDYEFTALMEDDLDRIASGDEQRTAWLRRFYFGGGEGDEGLKELVSDLGEIDAAPGQHDRDRQRDRPARRPLRPLHRARRRAGHDLRRDPARRAHASQGRGAPRAGRPTSVSSAANPRPGRTVLVKNGRYGPYVTEVAEDGEKPRTASLFQVDVAGDGDPRGCAAAPRPARAMVGVDPGGDEEVIVSNGRYGPYVKRGADTRSLESEEQLLTISLDEALALLAQPKQRGGGAPRRRCASSARRPGERQADRGQGRPLRPVRHRRRDEREPSRRATRSRRSPSSAQSS